MQYFTQIILLPFLFYTSLSCGRSGGEEGKAYYVEWDNSSLIRIAEEGVYPRLQRLNDNSLLVVYENRRGDVVAKRSIDEGVSWSDPAMLYKSFDFFNDETKDATKVNISNPEITQLNDGTILLATNLRPVKEGVFPFSIAIRRSMDNGDSWSEPSIIYKGGTFFRDGCWEPSFLVLPNGMIHLYFANESPYKDSDEQEISMIYSSDNGDSWSSNSRTVSFRKGKRDGMPVAVHDGANIYLAIEDNLSGQFKPYIVKNPIESAWNKPVYGNSEFRFSALSIPLSDEVYAGAPYLISTKSGLYLLSYQTTDKRSSKWELSTMAVAVSNSPVSFGYYSQPFNVPLDKEAKWNSLADLGNNSIAALSSTNFDSEKIGIWMVKGKIKDKKL